MKTNNKRTKRMATTLLTLTLTVTLMMALALPAAASTSGTCGENLTWTLDETGTLTISGTGPMYDFERDGDLNLNIPWYYDLVDKIYSVVISDGVTSIGNLAFYTCVNMRSIKIPKSVMRIGDEAFTSCGLTTISIPSSVTEIGESVFASCIRLTEILVSEKNSSYASIDGNLYSKDKSEIVQYAFGKTEEAFTVPSTVVCIGRGAFADGNDYLENVTLSSGVIRIKEKAFYRSGLKNISIPEGTVYIEDFAFGDCYYLNDITLPTSVMEIGDSAFRNCGTKTILIPEGVQSIGAQAFAFCDALESVFISASVERIGVSTFGYCKMLRDISVDADNLNYSALDGNLYTKDMSRLLQYASAKAETAYTMPDTVLCIDESAFSYCDALKSITLSDRLEEMGDYVFVYCRNLESITIPVTVKSIAKQAFAACTNLSSVTLGSGVTSIGDQAFASCAALKNIVIPSDVTTIGYSAFSGCASLKEIIIPEGVKSIGENAFAHCKSLKSITFPKSVTEIGEAVLKRCERIEMISVDEANSEYCSIDGNLYTKDKSTLIQYAVGKYETSFSVPNGVKRIAPHAFSDCYFESLKLPDSVKSIEEYAFQNGQIFNIRLSNSLESIGERAFDICGGFQNIIFPQSIESIGSCAFLGTNLQEVYYKGSQEAWNKVAIETDNEDLLTAEMHYDFSFDTSGECGGNLTWTLDENGILTISGSGEMQFDGRAPWDDVKDAITSVIIADTVTSIADYAFDSCYFLEDAEIPDSIVRIGDSAFSMCYRLKNIMFPNGVTVIGDHAFYFCTSFENVSIPSGVASVGEGAFSYIGLKSISVDFNNSNYCSIDGNLYSKDKAALLQYATEKTETSFDVPSGVTLIASSAFAGASHLQSITLPGGLTSIGDGAFAECESLESITIPSGVRKIGGDTFWFCKNLTSITIPISVTEIGEYAFDDCISLTNVYYTGSQKSWERIIIKSGNTDLTEASIQCQNTEKKFMIYDTVNKDVSIYSDEELTDAKLIIATYKGEELIGFKIAPVSIAEGETRCASPLTDFGNADTVRIMLWNSTGVTPLIDPLTLRLEN